jgi:hypothetical protein
MYSFEEEMQAEQAKIKLEISKLEEELSDVLFSNVEVKNNLQMLKKLNNLNKIEVNTVKKKKETPVQENKKIVEPLQTSSMVDFSIINSATQQSLTINSEFDDTFEIGINQAGKESVVMVVERENLQKLIKYLQSL